MSTSQHFPFFSFSTYLWEQDKDKEGNYKSLENLAVQWES